MSVVQKTINNLKDRPKDEKTAVATGVSALVVAVLLFAWGLWFVSNIKRGGQFDTYIGTKQQDFLPSNLQGVNEKLRDLSKPSARTLRELRDSSVESVQPIQDSSSGGGDLFSLPTGSEF